MIINDGMERICHEVVLICLSYYPIGLKLLSNTYLEGPMKTMKQSVMLVMLWAKILTFKKLECRQLYERRKKMLLPLDKLTWQLL
jgi:hypothetical protein